jgi:hypothetical protein
MQFMRNLLLMVVTVATSFIVGEAGLINFSGWATNCDGKGGSEGGKFQYVVFFPAVKKNHCCVFHVGPSCNTGTQYDSPCSQRRCHVSGGSGYVNAGCDAGSTVCWGRAEVYQSGLLASGGTISGTLSVSGHDHYVFQMHSPDCMSQRFGLNWNSGTLLCDNGSKGGSCPYTGAGNVVVKYDGAGTVSVNYNNQYCCSIGISRDNGYCVRFGDYVAWNVSSAHSTSWSNVNLA